MNGEPMSGVATRLILVAGATSASGEAVCRSLINSGATVLAVGRRAEALNELEQAVPGVDTRTCDLADRNEVAELAMRIHVKFGRIDGLVHLVGGWRGGGGITGQTDEDWDFFDAGFRTVRNTTRVFYDDLVQSPAGRLASVSSTSVEHPTAGSANYAAAKAAADAWIRACAQGFQKNASNAAAALFVVTSLAGLESALGDAVVDLWNRDPASINGHRIPLT